MSIKALAIAATGMSAQQTNLDVVANNIANINTTGFKRARAEFTDLLYETINSQGTTRQVGLGEVPEGAKLGLGTRLAAIRDLHLQGVLKNTGNPLDIAVNGRGWIQVRGPDGDALYTRAGAFNIDQNGQIVNIDGYALEPSITVPANVREITINGSGQISVLIEGQIEAQEIGQIVLSTFANEAGLEPLGKNMFAQTQASGTAVQGVPGSESYGEVSQGYLESSNVDPVKEIMELISAQRAYEMNSKVIQAADEMSSVVTQGMR